MRDKKKSGKEKKSMPQEDGKKGIIRMNAYQLEMLWEEDTTEIKRKRKEI